MQHRFRQRFLLRGLGLGKKTREAGRPLSPPFALEEPMAGVMPKQALCKMVTCLGSARERQWLLFWVEICPCMSRINIELPEHAGTAKAMQHSPQLLAEKL